MEEYAKMFDKQDEDRINEIKARGESPQCLMDRMAIPYLWNRNRRN